MPHRCRRGSPAQRNASLARSVLSRSMSQGTSAATQPPYRQRDPCQPNDPRFRPTDQARTTSAPFAASGASTPTGCRQSASGSWRSPHHCAERNYLAAKPARMFPALNRQRSMHHIPTFEGIAKFHSGVAQSTRLAPTQPRHRMHLHPDAQGLLSRSWYLGFDFANSAATPLLLRHQVADDLSTTCDLHRTTILACKRLLS